MVSLQVKEKCLDIYESINQLSLSYLFFTSIRKGRSLLGQFWFHKQKHLIRLKLLYQNEPKDGYSVFQIPNIILEDIFSRFLKSK